MENYFRIFLFLTALLSLPPAIFAQGPPNDSGRPDESVPASSLDVVVDTSIYFYLYGQDPGKYYPIEDTLLGDYFSQYDPIRQTDPDQANLGNLGTAHRRLLFAPEDFRGVTLGVNQFDLYRITPEQMRFYRVQQAFSRMQFSQGATQEDTYFQAEFGRNFDKGLSFSINYRRINNQGAYDFQRATNNAFGLGFWYQSPRGRYESFLIYTANSETLEENGGIAEEVFAGTNTLVDPVTVPVRLNDPMSRYDHSEYSYVHYLHFLAPRDSTGRLRNTSIGLSHQISWRQQGIKFYDDNLQGDETYYGDLLTDVRGLRHFVRLNTLSNSVDLFLSTQRKASEPEAPPIRRSFLRAGIIYDQHWLNQEPQTGRPANLLLRGTWDFTPGPAFQASAYAHLGFLANLGDWRISGRMAASVSDWFSLEGAAIFQQRSPTLLEEQMFISQREIWNTDFRKHTETRIEGGIHIPKTRTRASVVWNLTDGFIFYDTLGVVQQLSNTLNIPQLRVEQNIQVWKLHLDNQVFLQGGTDNELRLPAFYSTHSLYFEGFLFRDAMYTRLGTDLRLVGPHQPVAYFPLTGQFIQQNGQELDWQPFLDAFVTFKVDKFRFFFRLENILASLTQDYYYLIADHPQQPLGLRFGISWQFVE